MARILGTLVLAASLLAGGGASAATLVVNNAADDLTAGDGQCTLREAVLNANADADTTGGDCAAGSGADEIHIPSGHYLLSLNGTAGGLILADDATLIGAGADLTVIDAGGVGGVLRGGFAAVDVAGVTITGGSDFLGGGIVSYGDLTLIDTVVSGNSGGFSGGIFADGTTTLIRSTVSGNSAGPPGVGGPGGVGGILFGALFPNGSLLRLHNSTVSGNHYRVGVSQGSCEAAGIYSHSDVELNYTTIADNECLGGSSSVQMAAASGVGIYARGSVISSQAGMNCDVSLAGSYSGGYNIDSDGSCGFVDPTDQSGVDPLLGPLQDNGGPTWTHALLPGSPAIDAIPRADCTWDDDGDPGTPEVPLTEDQRGISRPRGAGCDIGAFERAPSTPGASCGIGPELVLITPLLMLAHGRRKRRERR